MRLSIVACLAVFALAGAGPASPAQPAPADPALAQLDPAMILGRLPNGLTYAVKQVSATEGASIVLYMKAGAFQEEPGERGLAHFIEHMAFRGSAHFPSGSLFAQFAQQGIAAGRDQNAGTALFGTTFFIDVPKATDPALGLSAAWLRDVADGLTFKPEDVDGERGAVLSELAERQSVARTQAEAAERFFAPGLRAAGRSAGGDTAVVKAAGPAQLRAFYQRWYRPENAIVVATGNRPPEVLKALVEKQFSSWSNRTPPPAAPPPGAFDAARATEAQVFTDPQAQTTIQVCRYQPARPHKPEGVDSWVDRLADEAWSFALRQRLARAADGASAPFVRAQAGVSAQVYYQLDAACLEAQPAGGDWAKALTGLSSQVRSFEAFGLSQAEFAQFQLGVVNRSSSQVDNVDQRVPHDITDTILANLVSGDTFDTAEEDRRMQLTALSRLTRDKVNQAFHARWSSAAAPLIFVTTPQPVARDSVLSTWRTLQTAAAEPVAAPTARDWPYVLAARPGTVVKREVVENPGFVRLTFANGLVVNFKQTAYAKDSYLMVARFGAGLAGQAPEDRYRTLMASASLPFGGLGKLSGQELADFCRQHGCGVALVAGTSAFTLAGASKPGDLQLELQLVSAYLSDPGFRPELNARVPILADSFFRTMSLDPVRVAEQARVEAVMPDVAPPPKEVLSHYTAADFDRVLRPALTQSPVELTLVGDLTEAEATRALAATLGALPPRAAPAPALRAPEHLSYDKAKALAVQAHHTGPKDRAALVLTWPLFVPTADRIREEHVLALVAGVFQNAAFDEMREKLGKTYTPAVALGLPEGGDQGSLNLVVQGAPSDIGVIEEAADKIAARLANGEITEADVDRVRIPIVAKAADRRTNNGWWLAAMDGSAKDPMRLKNLLTYDDDLRSITLDEIKAEARRWLQPRPFTASALPQAVASVDKSAP